MPLPRFATLFLAAVAALPGACAADATADRLARLLRQYPAADANGDGVLSLEEATAHARLLRQGKKASAPDANAPTQKEKGPPKPAPTHTDVAYGPHARHRLDLWLAQSAAPAPLVVFIHGGGFVNGSKSGASAEMIRGCLDAGVSFMAINYRFRDTAPIQDILRDCARSIQFVRAHAGTYNLDPKRIASFGGSAGAGSSLWLAFHADLADPQSPDPVLRQSSRIVAAGALNTQATYHLERWPEFIGPYNTDWSRPGETLAFYGAKSAADADSPAFRAIRADVDMLALVSKDDPPVFLYTSHADGDTVDRGHYLHHPRHALAVKAACDAAGVDATVWFAQREPRLTGSSNRALLDFLLRHLRAAAP